MPEFKGRLRLSAATGPEDAPVIPPGGRRPRVYRLQAGALRLTRKRLELSHSLSIEELRLLKGAIRIDGPIDAGLLKIGFIEAEEVRILGNCVNNSIMAVAFGGGRLDMAASFPGSALTLNVDATLARRIVPEISLPRLLQRMRGPHGIEALLYPVTPKGRALKDMMRGVLARSADGEGRADAARERLAREMIRMSAGLIDEILRAHLVIPNASLGRRRELALAVESFLWESPQQGGVRRLSLDDAANRLQCSRRSIQLALYEEFGIGFVALKRAIRLQQVHAILRVRQESASGIGRIASAHEFRHLSRFARHYRDMFGVLPSLDLPDAANSPA